MQPISKSVVAGLSAASTIAAVHAARQQTSSSPARSSDIPRGTPSPVPTAISQQLQPPPSNAAVSGSGLLAGGPDGGGAINYVSSSDSSSPLSETYRPANECPASIGGAAATAAGAAAASSNSKRRQSAFDSKTCFKQVQFHLNNIAHAAPLLKHKLGGSAAGGLSHSISPSGNASGSAPATAAAAAAAATTTTQARLLSQIPILRSVRKTRKKRKKVKPSEAAKLSSAAAAAEAQHQQQVLANLPPSKAFLYSCLSKAAAKVPDGKDIVYNGTFPIDQPLCSRFKNLSFSLSSTDTELDGSGMPRGFERGATGIGPTAGEQMLRKRNSATGAGGGGGAGAGKVVKTFAIDEPI